MNRPYAMLSRRGQCFSENPVETKPTEITLIDLAEPLTILAWHPRDIARGLSCIDSALMPIGLRLNAKHYVWTRTHVLRTNRDTLLGARMSATSTAEQHYWGSHWVIAVNTSS